MTKNYVTLDGGTKRVDKSVTAYTKIQKILSKKRSGGNRGSKISNLNSTIYFGAISFKMRNFIIKGKDCLTQKDYYYSHEVLFWDFKNSNASKSLCYKLCFQLSWKYLTDKIFIRNNDYISIDNNEVDSIHDKQVARSNTLFNNRR